jgi:ubiquinone/menaquinone biosynthesis C-methylase UbiE
MPDEKPGDFFWNEWKDILGDEFECRLTNIGAKGYGMVPARKSITALFLQIEGFNVGAADILPEAIRIIRKREIKDSDQPEIPSFEKDKYDAVAMMGHRIGIVENVADLKQYLQDVRKVLQPGGQILLTSFNVKAANGPGRMSYQRQNVPPGQYPGLQLQEKHLVGPFFCLLRIKAEIVKGQAAMTNWQYKVIYQQDESNYLVRLGLSESR